MAAERTFDKRKSTGALASEEKGKPLKSSNVGLTSKRKRYFHDDDDNGMSSVFNTELQNLLAKQLSDYLDKTIEEVSVGDLLRGNSSVTAEEEDSANAPTTDFQLFSTQLMQTSCVSMNFSVLKDSSQCHQSNKKTHVIDSSSSDDDEYYARLQEAAVSVQDIFGHALDNDVMSKIGPGEKEHKHS